MKHGLIWEMHWCKYKDVLGDERPEPAGNGECIYKDVIVSIEQLKVLFDILLERKKNDQAL